MPRFVCDDAMDDFITPLALAAHTRDEVRRETIRRLEHFILRLLSALQSSHFASLSSLSDLCRACTVCCSQQGAATTSTATRTTTTTCVLLRSLRRLLLVVNVLYDHVLHGTVITQREVYYRLVRTVPHQRMVNETVQQLVHLLGVPRTALGVMAGSRGFVAGTLHYCADAGSVHRGGNTFRDVYAPYARRRRVGDSEVARLHDDDATLDGDVGVSCGVQYDMTPPTSRCVPPRASPQHSSCRGSVRCRRAPQRARSASRTSEGAADEGGNRCFCCCPRCGGDVCVESDMCFVQSMAIPAVLREERDVPVCAPAMHTEPCPVPVLSSSRSACAPVTPQCSPSPSTPSCLSSSSLSTFQLHRCTRFIVVVEKYTVFDTLMREELCRKVPCVLLTAQGCPTHAARVLLCHLHRAAPHIPVVALMDYNPSGFGILMQYRFGLGSMYESAYYAIPALRWLGPRRVHWIHPPRSTRDNNNSSSKNDSTDDRDNGLTCLLDHVSSPTRSCTALSTENRHQWSFGATVLHQTFTARDRATMRTLLSRLREQVVGHAACGDTGREGCTPGARRHRRRSNPKNDNNDDMREDRYAAHDACRSRQEQSAREEVRVGHRCAEGCIAACAGRKRPAQEEGRRCGICASRKHVRAGAIPSDYYCASRTYTSCKAPPGSGAFSDDVTDATSMHAWMAEATAMHTGGVKMEIESLYSEHTRCSVSGVRGDEDAAFTATRMTRRRACTGESFAEWVCRCLLRHDYI